MLYLLVLIEFLRNRFGPTIGILISRFVETSVVERRALSSPGLSEDSSKRFSFIYFNRVVLKVLNRRIAEWDWRGLRMEGEVGGIFYDGVWND
jgi:hypothetical protein